MNYKVIVVEDHELPNESGWVIIRTPVGDSLLLVTDTVMATRSGWGVAWRACAMIRDLGPGFPMAV